jgi:hypothetical protein
LSILFYFIPFIRIKHWRKHGGAPPEGVGQAVGQAAAIIRKANERRDFAGRGGGRFGGRGGGGRDGGRGGGGRDGGRGGGRGFGGGGFGGGRGGPPQGSYGGGGGGGGGGYGQR